MAPEGRRYHVQHVLGRGGFGTVYLAEMLSGGGFAKPVALKVLNQEMGAMAEVAQRLRDEARLLGRLKHPAILRVDDLVQLEGAWTVVMELLAGANLHQVVRASGPLPVGVALEVAHVVAGALHAAHDRPGPGGEPLRVLHRDIKPSNIQLTPLGEVKVLDFGVARASFATREAATRSLIFGSVGYMAPERMAGRDSHAGDVYALGVVLYEILAGRRFGTACSRATLQATMVEEALGMLPEDRQDDELLSLLRAVMAFEPSDRPRADAFQRRARKLRARHPEPWISDWADSVLREVMDEQEQGTGPLSGKVLRERRGADLQDDEADGEGAEPPRQHAGTGFTPPPFQPAEPNTPTAGINPTWQDAIPSEPIGLPPLPPPRERGASSAKTPVPTAETPVPTVPRPATTPEPEPPVEPEAGSPPVDQGHTQFERLTPPTPSPAHVQPLREAGTTMQGSDAPVTAAEPTPAPTPTPSASSTSDQPRRSRLPLLGLLVGGVVTIAGLIVVLGPVRSALRSDREFLLAEPAEASVTEPLPATPTPQDDLAVEREPALTAAHQLAAARAAPPTSSPMKAAPAASGQAETRGEEPSRPAAQPTQPAADPTQPASPPSESSTQAPEPTNAVAVVTLVGDASAVAFTDDHNSYGPGEVPPGDYVIYATFPGLDGAVQAGTLRLGAGQSVWVECQSGFDRCAVFPVWEGG